MWGIWWANNVSRWQMGFNLVFKGLKLLSPIIADLYTLDLEVKLLVIKIWGFDHDVGVALPGCSTVQVGSLFLRFWDKVYVPSLRAKQAKKCVCGDGLVGNFMGTSHVGRGKVGCGEMKWGKVNAEGGGHGDQPARTGERRLEKKNFLMFFWPCIIA